MTCCCVSVDAGWQIKNIGSFKNEIGHQLRKLQQYLLTSPRDLESTADEGRGEKRSLHPLLSMDFKKYAIEYFLVERR